ncbi:MAG: hypothetical protein KME42_13990 [Tildeniella nuda ZEHNDER 1965/U140]|jgi:hypothetical protein|nr:hypothetical protein [Tildeniella nuda ZEHNDER 1965/U140]
MTPATAQVSPAKRFTSLPLSAPRPIATPPQVRHIVTLINRRTEDERTLTITTKTDRFTDVIREIAHQKVINGLMGYEIWETLSEPGF